MSVPLPQLPAGGIIRGIGIDLVDCHRISAARERHGDRFLHRVYTRSELDYCMGQRDPIPSLAARFAAKEAVAKAFTTGIGGELGWHSIGVMHGDRQQPIIQLDAAGLKLLNQLSASDVLISLTHTAALAAAVAVIVG
jgi:holo-[acyl-carrier protein] synthase